MPQATRSVQEVLTPGAGPENWGEGVWGTEAYWNNNVYYGGTKPGASSNLAAYSFTSGELSTSPTSTTSFEFPYPGPTPSISANGTTNGILWALGHGSISVGSSVLLAYDATNLANLLYSSNANLSRDNPGPYVEFTVPTITNGKVYVGASGQISAYGLLGTVPTVAPPVISPPGTTFTGSQKVTITDTTPGAQIFYTTDGSTPTNNSTPYSNTTPITVTSNETITAIASATGYLQGPPVSAVFSSTANAANPVFLLAGGTYSGKQTVGITDATTAPNLLHRRRLDSHRRFHSLHRKVHHSSLRDRPGDGRRSQPASQLRGQCSLCDRSRLHFRFRPGLRPGRGVGPDAVQRQHRPGRLPAAADQRRL